MPKESRSLSRRKAQSDRKSSIRQTQLERQRKIMNGKAPAAAQPEMEIKRFTEAEFKALGQKMQKYQEAANVVNEFLDFLRQQHGVESNEGWQLGEGCFVRPAKVAGVPAPAAPAAVASATKPRRPKQAKSVPPMAEIASVNGASAEVIQRG